MTLILTCATPAYIVQASDRLLTDMTTGSIVEDTTSKATLVCSVGTFGYTGLASIGREPTHRFVTRHLAPFGVDGGPTLTEMFDTMAQQASATLRRVVVPPPRNVLIRTSFIGGMFLLFDDVGPEDENDYTPADFVPAFVLISNAQDLSNDQWRDVASTRFDVHIQRNRTGRPALHATGQPVPKGIWLSLRRGLRRLWLHTSEPLPAVRLLAEAVQAVSDRNRAVGRDVMCAIVRRPTQMGMDRSQIELAGSIPLRGDRTAITSLYRSSPQGPQPSYVFVPGGDTVTGHCGVNFACAGVEMWGQYFGPPELAP